MTRYLDPRNDIPFRKIFGEQKHILRSFLNALLPLPVPIKSLEYLSPQEAPAIPLFKNPIVDVRCTDQLDRQFIVEMQIDYTPAFTDRVIFNGARAYVNQLMKGEDYTQLKSVYGLSLVDSIYDRTNPDYLHHIRLAEVNQKGEVCRTFDNMVFVFVELPKFVPPPSSSRELKDLWLLFMTKIREGKPEDQQTIPKELLTVDEINEALKILESSAYNPDELRAYERYWDAVSVAKTYQKDRLEEGHAKGLEEGLAQGKAEGKAEGIRESIATLLSIRFGPSAQKALEPLSQIQDMQHLNQLLSLAISTSSLEDFLREISEWDPQHG